MPLPRDLDRYSNKGYGQLPIGERDLELREALEACLEATEGAVDVSEESNGPVLRLLAERLASLAVRSNEPALLVTALRSLVLGSTGDRREAAAVLPLIHRSAELLNLDFVTLAQAATRSLAEPVAAELTVLGRRPVQPIATMGYRERGSGRSFRFERTW